MKRIMILLLVALTYHGIAQIYTQDDIRIFNQIVSGAEKINLSDSTLDKIIIHVGRQFLGTAYVGGLLDKPEKECLVINLNGLDCVTFLESTVALSLIIKENKTRFEDFCEQLKFIRYRNGILDGYSSRLHYFYEWLNNNQQKGILENITEVVGGKPYDKKVNFMTANFTKYPHLGAEHITIIKKVEEELSTLQKFCIPKAEIWSVEDRIDDGDLVAFATTINGLEVEHVGIAIHVNGRLHLMHASSVNKKVEISKFPLSDMAENKSTYAGIIVARMKNPLSHKSQMSHMSHISYPKKP